MRPIDVARLVGLAFLWGISFLFVRVLAPEIGPAATATLRLVISSIALLAWLHFTGRTLGWREHWRSYVPIGAFNSAIPFFLYGFAALTLPASYLVVFNATSPLFGALLATRYLGEPLTLGKAAGIAAGIAGVALIAGAGPVPLDGRVLVAVLACLGSATCYGIAGILMKRRATQADSEVGATGSQIGAALLLAPAFVATGGVGVPSVTAMLCLLGIGVLSSSVAYVLYFRLVADVGPSRALTVTFLSPAFGVALGALILGERLTPGMLAGGVLVVAGTALVLRAR
jgi:drug/metabolite transporter (DMT)-like permease